MLSKQEIKNAARGRWHEILSSIGVPEKFLKMKHGPCPICAGHDRFRFDDKRGDGTFFCNQCGPGDGLALIRLATNCSFPEALKSVCTVLGIDSTKDKCAAVTRLLGKKPDPVDTVNWHAYREILELWERGLPVTAGDPVGKYLIKTRGIPLQSFPPTLRIVSVTPWDFEMLAAFTNSQCELVQVQKLLLTRDGQKRFTKDGKCKLFMHGWKEGVMNGGAIKLYHPQDTLALSEGVETALAFFARYQIPVWSTSSAHLLEHVEIPSSVERVIILADNDRNKQSTGERAANALAIKLEKAGFKSEIWLPNEDGKDFADLFSTQVSA